MRNFIEPQIGAARGSRKEQTEIKPEEQSEVDLLVLGKAEEMIHTLLIKMRSKNLPEELREIPQKEKKSIRKTEVTFSDLKAILTKVANLYRAKDKSHERLRELSVLKVQLDKAAETDATPQKALQKNWLIELSEIVNELETELRQAIQGHEDLTVEELKKFPKKYPKQAPQTTKRKRYNEATISF